MRNDLIIKSKTDFEKVKELAAQIFYKNGFPKLIFKNHKWELIFLESWNIFNENSYDKFISFVKDLNENKIFLSPDNISEYTTGKYMEKVSVETTLHYPVVCFNPALSFIDFHEMQDKLMYRNATDSFLFSNTAQWGIYVNTNIDLMILGYDPSIRPVIEMYYKDYKERITSIQVLLDDVETWAKKDKVVDVKQAILKNYQKCF